MAIIKKRVLVGVIVSLMVLTVIPISAAWIYHAASSYAQAQAEKLDYRGDGRVVITLVKHDGTPADDFKYAFYGSLSGTPKRFFVNELQTKNGVIQLENISTDPTIIYGLVSEKNVQLASFGFSDDEKEKVFQAVMPVSAGDSALELELYRVADGEKASLLDAYQGKVVYLDFWASWCGPCQMPMKKADEMLANRSADWGDRVSVVAVSVDDSIEIIRDHVNERGWHNVDHYWIEEGKSDPQTRMRTTYSVLSVPTALLIDQTGTIVWRGHPATYDFEKEIDRLLAGAP